MKLRFPAFAQQFGPQIILPRGYHRSVRWLPKIGDLFPDFRAESTIGDFRFHEWAEGHWVMLSSHPAAFTSICTTEIGDLADYAPEFSELGVKIASISQDSVEDNLEWTGEIEKLFGVSVDFPLVTDPEGRILESCGMMHPKDSADRCIRKTFIIDPALRIRAILEYPNRVGRSVPELLRILEALQAGDLEDVGTPSGWSKGDPLLVPDEMSTMEAAELYAGRLSVIAPYLRVVAALRP